VTTYNHTYSIVFSISGSTHPEGDDLKSQELRSALLNRIHDLSDDELLEALGVPLESEEEDPLIANLLRVPLTGV
jgi:hypothetical protein